MRGIPFTRVLSTPLGRAQRTCELAGWTMFRDGCPKGESAEQIAQRVDRTLATILALDGTVAVISHGHFVGAPAVRWIGLPIAEGRHFALETGSLSIVGYEHPDQETPVISL